MFRIPSLVAKSRGSVVKPDRRVSRHRPMALRLRLETLEERTVLSGIVTTSISGYSDSAMAGFLEADDDIVLAGRATASGEDSDFAVVRYKPNGLLDTGFGDQGVVTTRIGKLHSEGASAAAAQADGRIVVAGSGDAQLVGTNVDFAVACYNADGSLDNQFGGNGKNAGTVQTDLGSTDGLNGVMVQPDGKIVAAGCTNAVGGPFVLARYTPTGQLDPDFGAQGIVQTSIPGEALVVSMHDGKILAGGSLYGEVDPEDSVLVRYNLDGSLDTGFGNGGIVTTDLSRDLYYHEDRIRAIAVDGDGKIVVAGYGAGAFMIARYNSDGTLDETFGDLDPTTPGARQGFVLTEFGGGLPGNSDDEAMAMALEADGKIVAAGYERTDAKRFALARYNADGTLDGSFGSGGTVVTPILTWAVAQSVGIQSDGKIVVSGYARTGLSAPEPSTVIALARYNTDGTLDGTFGVPTPPPAGITVEPTSGLATAEDGSSDTFTVVLDSQPDAEVTIAVSSSKPAEGTVSTASLVFDSGNWSTPQTVTVTGVDDQIEDGNVAYTIVLAPAVSTDSGYNGLDPADVAVTNLDNDAAELFFQSTDVPKTIADPHPRKGPRDTESLLPISGTGAIVGMIDVDVSITHPSMTDLTVTLTSPGGVVKPLFFDGAEWNLGAATDFWGKSLDGTWVLTATDNVANGVTGTLESWSITASTLSGPGVTVSPISGLSTTESGGTARFMVILNSQPTGVVRINFCPNDTTEGRLEQANSDDVTLTFDPETWAEPQEVVIVGMDDPEADGDVFYTIIAVLAETDDPAYWDVDPDDIEVTNLDDDAPLPLLADFDVIGRAARVTLAQVQMVTSEALALWSARLGVAVTSDLQVALADLAPGRLGEAHGGAIVLDADANGAGWFVDETPWEHSEFVGLDSPASGRVDLLTVVAHEIGHTLGFGHSADEQDAMADRLGLGTRRLPGGAPLFPPPASAGFQALDEVLAALGWMEAAEGDAEDEAVVGTEDELADLLVLADV